MVLELALDFVTKEEKKKRQTLFFNTKKQAEKPGAVLS